MHDRHNLPSVSHYHIILTARYPFHCTVNDMSESRPRLVVVDTFSLVFQVFHAIPPMSSPTGLPTNALFGLARDLMSLRGDKPDFLVCALDLDGPTFRQELYPEYKAHRPPMPHELALQIPHVTRMFEAIGVAYMGVPGFEADDVMATLVKAGVEQGYDVVLCTTDKDCRQLLGPHVRLLNLRRQTHYDTASLKEDWGVEPGQVIDLQALVGDATDNVPGAPGIGPKTAAKLLEEFGSLEGLHANIDKVKGKKGAVLKENWHKVELSRKLVALRDDVPLEADWNAWKLAAIDSVRAAKFFREMGFRSLTRQVEEMAPAAAQFKQPAPTGTRQGDLFAQADDAPEKTETAAPSSWDYSQYRVATTPDQLQQCLDELIKQSRFAIDLETTGLNQETCQIVGISLSWKDGEGWYLPILAPDGDAHLDSATTLQQLKPILENPKPGKVNQNIKFDWRVLAAQGIEMRGIVGDTMVADYLLHAGERSHGLDELSRRYLGHRMIPITDLIGPSGRKTPQKRMDQVPVEQVARYACEDADAAWRLTGLLESALAETGSRLPELYRNLEVPLVEVLARMERAGILIDTARLNVISEEMRIELAEIESNIYEMAGRPFNVQSLPQLRQVLFEEMGLPIQGKTGTTGEASTDQESLEKLVALNLPASALPRLLLRHRQISKLKGTYVDALPDLAGSDGRVRASFNQTVTATGRLSSSDPNLQNIPVRRDEGQQIRQAFIAPPGHVLISADYSQIELRLLAHLTGDSALINAFQRGIDVHAAVAAEIYGTPVEMVDDAMRRTAKMVNFGVIYGISAFGLAQRLGVQRDQASAFIDAYFARYPTVLAWQEALLDSALTNGYVETFLGRRRAITGLKPTRSYRNRTQPEREAINMAVQGSAADLIKLAMLKLDRALATSGTASRLVLQIHDELLVECPVSAQATTASLVRAAMRGALDDHGGLLVPLDVDVSAGPNWLDVEAITDDNA